MVASGFFGLGCFIALIVKARSRNRTSETETEPEPLAGTEGLTATGRSIFEDENLMGIVSAAAPVVLPAVLRTASKKLAARLSGGGRALRFQSLGDLERGVPAFIGTNVK